MKVVRLEATQSPPFLSDFIGMVTGRSLAVCKLPVSL